MTIQQALQHAEHLLDKSSPSAALDAQVLLCHVLTCNTAHLAAWPEKQISQHQSQCFIELISQRRHGRPIAYLTGQREFWSLTFSVDDSTLIPRPETETLVAYILDHYQQQDNIRLLDMGTGSGAIAISIANEKPHWDITATDISAPAIALANSNANNNQISNISFVQSDWFEQLSAQQFNIIVSNPPYIATDDPHLQQGDVRFEPESALTSGLTGMDDIEFLCTHASRHLKIDGCLILEHGYNQKQQVADCFINNRFVDIKQVRDLSGHTRMTAGKISR